MDSYLFVRVVGKGSYGEVNLVRHKSDRKQVTLTECCMHLSLYTDLCIHVNQ